MQWDKPMGVMKLWGTEEQVEAGKRRLDEIIDEARAQREQDPGGLAVRAELVASRGADGYGGDRYGGDAGGGRA